jgi:nucleolar complex protein 2
MMFGPCEVDGIFRKLLGKGDATDENKGSYADLEKNKKWKKLEPFVKAYLGNSLNILNQMTDTEMTAFTLCRLKASIPFLRPFPNWPADFSK